MASVNFNAACRERRTRTFMFASSRFSFRTDVLREWALKLEYQHFQC